MGAFTVWVIKCRFRNNKMSDILDVATLHADDAELKKLPADVARYGALPKHDELTQTVEALKANRWEVRTHTRFVVSLQNIAVTSYTTFLQVTLVPNKEAALAALKTFADAEKSYFASGSTTLQQVGWTTWLKENPAAFGLNYKVCMILASGHGV
jgi:hypothetical protein